MPPKINNNTKSRLKFRRIMKNQYTAISAEVRLRTELVVATICRVFCCSIEKMAVVFRPCVMFKVMDPGGSRSLERTLLTPVRSRVAMLPSDPRCGMYGIGTVRGGVSAGVEGEIQLSRIASTLRSSGSCSSPVRWRCRGSRKRRVALLREIYFERSTLRDLLLLLQR